MSSNDSGRPEASSLEDRTQTHLERALESEDTTQKHYHIRSALQLQVIKDER